MKKKLTHLFCLFFVITLSQAQDIDLSITTISPKLLIKTNSVVRYKDTQVTIVDQRKMNIEIRAAITILNKFADDEAELVVNYDKNTKIKNLKVIIYDAQGEEQQKIKESKFDDYSAADGMSLFNDGRLKHYRHVALTYPFTFYYEYEIETENTAFINSWQPITSYDQSIEQNKYSIQYPEDYTLQTLENKIANYGVIKNSTGTKISYSLPNTSAIQYEELNPGLQKIAPSVRFGINKFHLEGYDGTADSWQDFGKWMYENLINSRMDLPESAKQRIQQLVQGVDDPIERAKIVYDYVQKKTRYISVQVGIGGWMPMLASEVDKLSYGDCKALTNYTKALMDAAGVESYYTAVYANNKQDIEKDLISVQGNHVFLFLPQPNKEDIWLECTSQSVPFGYQGSFTDDRNVLVLKPEGGELKHTGVYRIEDNLQVTDAAFSIDNEGNLTGSVAIKSGGLQYDDHYQLGNASERDIEAYYKDGYWSYLNNLSLEKHSFTNDKDSILFKEQLTVSANSYATFSGDRLLFNLNAFNRVSSIPKRYSKRKLPFEIGYGYYDVDNYVITYPKGYEIEGMPSNVSIKNKFGSYELTVEKLPNQHLKFTRSLTLNSGEYVAKDYAAYRNFRRAIVKLDKSKIVMSKI